MDKEQKCENCKWYVPSPRPPQHRAEIEDEYSHFEHLGKCTYKVDEETIEDELPQWARGIGGCVGAVCIVISSEGDILNNNVSPNSGERCSVFESKDS